MNCRIMEYKFSLLVWICFIFYMKEVKCCGIITHTEIATRAREYFEETSEGVNYNRILKKHEEAFQAGAPYPDTYYPSICFNGQYNNVSEDTHWTPFMNATVNYIRRKYPKPWDQATEKLVVFLLAVVSHQVADVSWHSLKGVEQGFLTTMGMVNYHGSFPAAHSDGDFGGDVVNTDTLDLSYIHKLLHWYVPSEDLKNIYYDMYGNDKMSLEVIENCSSIFFLARFGESIGVIDKLYFEYAKRSTFLIDMLQDYFLGGMDDMAVWSTYVWRHTINMLDHGTQVCNLTYNPMFITCEKLQYYDRKYRAYDRLRRSLQDTDNSYNQEINRHTHQQDVSDSVYLKHKDRGIYVVAKQKLRQKLKRKLHRYEKKVKKYQKLDRLGNSSSNFREPTFVYKSSHSYSRLGESLQSGDFNGDGHMDLAIGAPLYSVPSNLEQGRVHIVYGTVSGLPTLADYIEHAANVTLAGTKLNGKFGSAMTVADLNADGIDDLVVSAPSVGSSSFEYHGEVYVFFGKSSGIEKSPNIQIYCQQTYCNLGWSLHGADVNSDGFKDLLIGSPFAPSGGEQRGFVGILYSNRSLAGKKTTLTEAHLSVIKGTQNYQWFGYSVTGGAVNGENWIVAGSPTYRICHLKSCAFDEKDIQAAGLVYGYKINSNAKQLVFTVNGQENFEQFGFNVHMASVGGDMKLFVSAGSEGVAKTPNNITQAGFVHIYEWSKLVEGNFVPDLSISGDKPFGRFGSNLLVGDFNGDVKEDVIISAPLRSNSFIYMTESGKAFLFSDVKSIEKRTLSANQGQQVFGVLHDKLRFAYSSAIVQRIQGSLLAFGLPHSESPSARLAGEVALFKIP